MLKVFPRTGMVWAAVFACLAAALVVLSGSPPASGTHYRANQLNWHKQSDGSVEFHATASWRCTFYSDPCELEPGDTFDSDAVDLGDGQVSDGDWTVVTVDVTNDVISAEKEFEHTYAGPGPFVVSLESCCRLSGPQHVNNPDGDVRVETLVDTSKASSNPVSSIPPIVDCAKDSVCTFSVPAASAQGATMKWRFATADESALEQPAGATVSDAGQYAWDTTGAELNTSGGDTYYSTQVMIDQFDGSDVVTKTPVDFFIRITDSANQQPVFESPTPNDGAVIQATAGTPMSFLVKASDPDQADTVSLGVLNKPSGAALTQTAGNPATGTFAWTPTAPGTSVINLIAQDGSGRGAVPRSVSIVVSPGTVPDVDLSIDDIRVNEGNAGTSPATFTVSLDKPSAVAVTVGYATASRTAVAGSDFAATQGTLTIPAGETTAPVAVQVTGDTVDEPDERFALNLKNAVNGSIVDATGVATIVDDERDGGFYCRATVVRANGDEQGTLNGAGSPCVDGVQTVGGSTSGAVSLAYGKTTTQQTPDDLATAPAIGDGASSTSKVTQAGITAAGILLRVPVLSSQARVVCGTVGRTPRLAGSSTVSAPRVGDQPRGPIIAEYRQIDVLGVLTIELNKQTKVVTSDGGRITQQALVISSSKVSGVDFVLGESVAGYSGSPCKS